MNPENPKIDEKRSQAIKAMWDKISPEDRISQTQPLREGRVKARQTRMVATLGDDPEATLKSMVEQGLSRAEIAMKLSKSEATIDYWLKRGGLHSGKSTTLGRDNIEYRRSLVQLATEAKLIEYLLPEDRKILEQRFLESGQVTPLEEIGKSFSLTRQRVQQKEARALTVLEKMLLGELIPKDGIADLRQAKRSKLNKSLGGDPATVLEDLVFNKGLSVTQVAHDISCSPKTISKRMRRLGISKRDRLQGERADKLGDDPGETLREWYWDLGLNLKEIGDQLKCSSTYAARLMEEYSISRRKANSLI